MPEAIELSVRFTTSGEDAPLTVSLFRPDTGVSTPPVPFTPPLDEGVLADLRWYLEMFVTWPTGPDYDRANRIESQMRAWGLQLLESITADRECIELWRQFVDTRSRNKLLTIDATDPRVLRLPWELLADKKGHLFARRISIRRRLQQATTTNVAPFTLPLRVLVVVSRPKDAGFIDARVVSRPLLDALDSLGNQAEVEFLYPPTLTMLTERLSDVNASPVHIVHFDGHGIYDAAQGLGYLLFEDDVHKRDLVDAERLGTLLYDCGVPLMVLNACQSAKQEVVNPYASVAASLIQSGVGNVLAMNYSVLVVAARKFVETFYSRLARGETVGQAVDGGRRKLLADEKRHTLSRRNEKGDLIEQTVRLRDWFLPALYQQSTDPVVFDKTAERQAATQTTPQTSTAAPTSIPPTLYNDLRVTLLACGPFDRDLDLRALFADARLGPWRNSLPHAESPAARVQVTIDYLHRQHSTNGDNALVLLLHTLREQKTETDACYAKLAGLAEALTQLAAPQPPNHPTTQPTSSPAALPKPPRHGFHGRAKDMLALERAFAERGIVVLHGFGGIGKTTLAAEAGRWFTRTGRFPGGAAFISFEHGGSLETLCSWVGQAVSGDADFVIHRGRESRIENRESSGQQLVDAVGEVLRDKPALVILDNFESVLGRAPLMPPDEVQAILDAVYTWADPHPNPAPQLRGGAKSRILITTRDTSFNDTRFAPSKVCQHIALGGLATADALDLAAAVLDDHGIDRAAIPRQALVDLMTHLGGHPLSLTLVLPHLREHTPEDLMTRFEALLPGFTEGKAQARNESLAVSLDFSLRRLGDATRAQLPKLAVFQGGAFEDDLLAITEIDPELWQAARAELEAAALVTVETLPGIRYPFLTFHPTLIPYLTTQLPNDQTIELEERYWQHYYAVAKYLYQSDTQHPHQARAIAMRELPNLTHALDLALGTPPTPPSVPPEFGGETGGVWLHTVVDFATRIAKFLNNFGRWRERADMMEKVERQMSNVKRQTSNVECQQAGEGLTQAEFLMMSQRGEMLLQQGQAAAAERVFRELLARMEAETAYDSDYDRGMTLGRLGRCLAAQGRPAQAVGWCERAVGAFARVSEKANERESESAKEMLGRVYTDLGDNLAAVGQFDQAQQAYESGLEISREVDDHRAVGVHLTQLGTLALRRGDLQAAATRYTEALETFRALGEPQTEAVAWHQLGMVAQEARDWEEAERCYREAFKLEEQTGNLPYAASTCNQLAMVAKGAGRLEDAERWYVRAIELGEQLRYNAELGKWLSNLAGLYLAQGRLEEAEVYAQRAVAIMETLDLSAQPWTTYNILAQIAEARGDVDAAAAWRRKEQESYAAYAGALHEIRDWIPIMEAVIAACRGNTQAEHQAENQLKLFEEGWPTTVNAARQILAGERDIEILRQDVTRKGYVVIYNILAQLEGDVARSETGHNTQDETGHNASGGEVARSETGHNQSGPTMPATPGLPEWAPGLVAAVAAAVQGEPQAVQAVQAVLPQLEQANWHALCGAVRSVLAGERDFAALQGGLDAQDAAIVRMILAQVAVARSETGHNARSVPKTGIGKTGHDVADDARAPGDGGAEQEGLTLEQLMGLVAVACGPAAPAGLGAQLFDMTGQLAQDARLPAEFRALGRVLNSILVGERDPDLSALPPALADMVRGLLAEVEEG